jgi:hypothetical protein
MTTKRSLQARAPLTDKELWYLTADQFLRLKLTDDEKARLRKINKEKEQERTERSARLRIEEEPILAELREIGLCIESVWDLVNTSFKYAEALPILLKHLSHPYSDKTKEGIARALAVPEFEVQKAWPLLFDEYCKAKAGWGPKGPDDKREYKLGAKDGLACALSAAVTDETLPELILLAKDRRQGESRILLLSALRKSRNPMAKQAIEELANEPELEKEIASWREQ